MDTFDFDDDFEEYEPRPPRQPISLAVVWNVLTGVMLLATVCVVVVFLAIFTNPTSAWNPFPPQALPEVLQMPTATNTPVIQFQPTWTPEPTLPPTPTNTPRPTATLPPTPTPIMLFTSADGESTATPGGMPFAMNLGSPSAISSQAFHPEAGCDWMGIAGQVLDITNAPISTGVIVQIGGTLGSMLIDIPTLPGLAQQYGQAGYEVTLADHPIASNDTLYIQLLDQAGLPLSDRITFDTYDDCERNLIFINLKQVR